AERRDASGEASSGIASAIATEAAGIAAFIAGWFIAWWLQAPFGPEAKAFLAVALSACLMVAVPVALANALLGRSASGRRRVAMDDGLARDLYRVVAAACGLIAAIFVFAQTLGILGAPRESALMVGGSLSPVIWLCMGWLVWRYRAAAVSAVTYALAADDRWGRSFARAWMPVAVVFLAVVWLLAINAMMRDQGGVAQKVLATFALPALVVALGAAARRAVDRAVARASTTTAAVAPTPGDDDQPVAQPTAGFAGSPGAGPLMRAIWLALGLGAIVVIGGLWGLRPAHFGLGGWLLVVTGELVGLLLVGYIVWGLIGLWVLMLHVRLVQSGGNPNAQRYMTLLPLFRRFLQIAIFTLGIMIGLSAIGLDIGPLLASAGVIGIAIGLGAQSTRSDILAGVFFLLEDAFRVGDYVEVGNIRGTVEGISLRALRLRHHRGAVHVLPFGQIKALTNTSRDWMLIRLEFSVAPDSDLQKIKKIVKGIGADLLKDPQYTQEFIVPIKSQGVRRIEDNALIIGVKYIAKPGAKVWMIRREAYQRIRDAFSKEGVRMASREVTVRVDRDGATVDDAAAAAAGGASAGRSGPT
ncbi:MAG: mechanosensitive ion channel family protein, partial [Rhodospirillales bacterium]|nr:mechanosensitive ion channel family protein [Rhodospirillales bacterium]